jgi:hypothetical protein
MRDQPCRPITVPVVIVGRILDAQNDEPLVFATVVVKGTKIGQFTDLNGEFQLHITEELVSPVTLSFSYIGYKSKDFKVNKHCPNGIQVKLKAESVLLEEVVIMDNAIPVEKTMCRYTISGIDIQSEKKDFIGVLEDSPEITVSPNPFTQTLRLDFRNMNKAEYQLHLIEMSGKEVWQGLRFLDAGENTVILDFPVELTNGSYLLHVNSEYGQLNKVIVRGGNE